MLAVIVLATLDYWVNGTMHSFSRPCNIAINRVTICDQDAINVLPTCYLYVVNMCVCMYVCMYVRTYVCM